MLPGAGYLVLGQRLLGAVTLLGMAGCAALAIFHLTSGLGIFESDLGALLFTIMLRAMAVVYAYAVVDAYFLAVDPTRKVSPRRRQAVVLNLLVPGAGYILAKAWLRLAVSLLVLGFIFYFAVQKNPYVDPIYVGLQVITSAFIYHYMRIVEAKEACRGQDPSEPLRLPPPPQLPKVASAQIVALVVVVVATMAGGLVVLKALPDFAVFGLKQDLQTKKLPDGIEFSLPPVDLTMRAVGSGWKTIEEQRGYLFTAGHDSGLTIGLRVVLVPPFVRTERYYGLVQRQVEQKLSLSLKSSRRVELEGIDAQQMEFSSDVSAVALRRDRVGLIAVIGCRYKTCGEARAARDRTINSIRWQP